RLNPSYARAQANLSLDSPQQVRALPGTPTSTPTIPVREAVPQARTESQLAHYALGLAFRQRGYLEEALGEYQLALEHGEDRAMVTLAMAEVRLLRRELAEARRLYTELVQGGSSSPRVWNELGAVLHMSGLVEDAIEHYRQSLHLDAGYALAENNLGVALAQSGDAQGALEVLERAVQRTPEFVRARRNLALLHFRAHRYTE